MTNEVVRKPKKMLHFRQLTLLQKNKLLSKVLIFENYKEDSTGIPKPKVVSMANSKYIINNIEFDRNC